MSNIENQLARAEAIIEALITENRLLKEKITLLEKETGNEMRPMSIVNNEDASGTRSVSIVKSDGGAETDSVSIVNNEDARGTRFVSIVKSDGGAGTDSVSIVKSDGGAGRDSVSIVKSDGGTETNSAFIVNSGEGAATLTGQLPKTIDPALYSSVATALRTAGINRVSGSYLLCVAHLIIHFHNGSLSDYPTLLRLTALSRGGLSKNMASMRKRGIIRKAGFQTYEITEWSKDILRSVIRKMI